MPRMLILYCLISFATYAAALVAYILHMFQFPTIVVYLQFVLLMTLLAAGLPVGFHQVAS